MMTMMTIDLAKTVQQDSSDRSELATQPFFAEPHRRSDVFQTMNHQSRDKFRSYEAGETFCHRGSINISSLRDLFLQRRDFAQQTRNCELVVQRRLVMKNQTNTRLRVGLILGLVGVTGAATLMLGPARLASAQDPDEA